MSRREFPRQVKRDALQRSGGFCEAVGGAYSLNIGKRCNAPLSRGVHFDHINADGLGGEPTLENCAAVCIPCHRIKTERYDIPRVAKLKRVADKHNGIRNTPSRPLMGTRASGWKNNSLSGRRPERRQDG